MTMNLSNSSYYRMIMEIRMIAPLLNVAATARQGSYSHNLESSTEQR